MHRLFKWLTIIWALGFLVVSCAPLLIGSGSVEGSLVGGLASFVIAATFVGPWFVVLVIFWIVWAVTKPATTGPPFRRLVTAQPLPPAAQALDTSYDPAGRWFVRSSNVRGLSVGAQIGLALAPDELLVLDADGRPGMRLRYGTFDVTPEGEDEARITADGHPLLVLGTASWVTAPALAEAVISYGGSRE